MKKTLDIIIPFYNELTRLPFTLDTLRRGIHFPDLNITQIIFVDDGSTDSGLNYLKNHHHILESELHLPIHIISYPTNHGRGFAIRHAAKFTESQYILYLDSDFSIPLTNLYKFIPGINQNIDLLYASKKMPTSRSLAHYPLIRHISGYGHTLLTSIILGVSSWDYQAGFKIFSRNLIEKVFPHTNTNRWGFDMEIIFLAKKMGFSTQEVPVEWQHIPHSKVNILKDSIQAIIDAWHIKKSWSSSNYGPAKIT